MVEAAAQHPLSRGLSLESNGILRSLCSAMSEAEIAARADEILDIRDEQELLKGLKILSYNHDQRTRYLIANKAADKAEFVRRYQVPMEEEMDLIVEVKVDIPIGSNEVKFLDPVGVFHLSERPRFDYDSRTLTGVTKYHGLEGGYTWHDDIWTSEAVMRRLPAEDITQEDVRYHIGCALDDLGYEGPELS